MSIETTRACFPVSPPTLSSLDTTPAFLLCDGPDTLCMLLTKSIFNQGTTPLYHPRKNPKKWHLNYHSRLSNLTPLF